MIEGSEGIFDRSESVGAVFLIFDRSRRPDRSALIESVSTIQGVTISHDPYRRDSANSHARESVRSIPDGTWLELLQWGMTFDCLGLSPGPGVFIPAIEYRLNIPVDQNFGAFEAIAITPGPHLADAANSLPVVRALLDLAAQLASHLEGVEAISWGPARTAMPPEFFNSAITSWIEGGPFPALCLTGFKVNPQGRLHTDGMEWFVGREIVLSAELSRDRTTATRIAMRVIHEIVAIGRLDTLVQMSTEDGTKLSLEPIDGNLIVRSSM